MLQVQAGSVDGTLVAAAFVAQAEGVCGAAANVVLAAVDSFVQMVLMVEVPAQVLAEQLQQAPGARQLFGSTPGVEVVVQLLLLLLAQIH